MTARPWMKWYPADWRADPKLRACDPISRYVWLEMLGLMHEAEPYGHLVSAGRAMDYRTLSRLIGVEVGEIKRAVKELEDRGVFSRTEAGVIFSRRMIRDEQRRKTRVENGRSGGNPALINQQDSGVLVNHVDNHVDKPQKPEAREEIGDGSDSESHEPNQETSNAAQAPPQKLYAFAGKVIRLTPRDYGVWRDRYHAIQDLPARLAALDEFYDKELSAEDRKKWFYRASTALLKNHEEELRRQRPPARKPGELAFTIGVG